jgi:hypothetical protein
VLFDRVYRLLVGQRGTTRGIEITELHIQFEIKKSAKKSPNRSTIRIWNLQKGTRDEFEKPDTRCVLYAGYADDAGAQLIFQGGVTYAWTKSERADIITEFELGDGAQEMRDSTISVGYARGVKSTQVLNDIARQMGTPLTLPSNAPERTWENGLSYYGSATGLLDKVTQGTGLEWSVQNGDLQVIQQGMVTTRQGIELALDSGLVYSPERVRKSKSEHKKKATVKPEYDGWRVKSLLMPMLNPGDRIKLSSRFVSGIFRIQEIKHQGDSHEGDWISEMKLIDPAAPISGEVATKGGVPATMDAEYQDVDF